MPPRWSGASDNIRTNGLCFERPRGVGVRAGLAAALDDARRNIVRVGAGTFYQRIEPELTLDVTRLDGWHQERVQIDYPAFFPAVPAGLEAAAASSSTIYVKDSELRAPQITMSAASWSTMWAKPRPIDA